MIVYTWARFDAGRVIGAHANPADAVDILPRVAWTTAESARDAAEAAYRDDWSDAPPLEWSENHERLDGRYPTFEATPTEQIRVRVYPLEIMEVP